MLTLPRTKNSSGNLHPAFMRTLASTFPLESFVETGTYLGDTTANASAVFSSVHTIELSDTLAAKARQRFAGNPHIHVHCGDSATMLSEVVGQLNGPALFWLDGHYSEGVTALGSQNTPIREELRIIAEKAPKGSIILIDDLRLFDERASQPAAPVSMHGYPTLNEIYADLSGMDYQLFVLGDVALATPKTSEFEVSLLIQALTISRLYDGSNLEIQEVLDAENIIVHSTGEERSVVSDMGTPYLATEQYGLGLHYRFWRALVLSGQDQPVQAGQEFVDAISKGFSHWRVRWYLARILREGGELTVSRKLVQEILNHEPHFQAGHEFLKSLPAARADSPAPLRPTVSTDRPLVDQLVALKAHQPETPLRLHLGCGEKHFSGYVNIDYPPSEHTCQTQIGADVFGDVTKLRLPEGGLHEIRLHHVFEHFQRSEALALLILWHEGLSIGGRLHIETPDVEGCARQLVSNIPFSMKQAVLRHCFGSQEAGWAIHYDGWTEAKYHHVLGKLGFAVKTVASSWPHPPHLANVEAVATKTRSLSRRELLAIADELLAEYMVADVASERTMCEVWRTAMREFLAVRTPPQSPSQPAGSALAASPAKKKTAESAELTGVHAVVFSKDRALQLDATLRSFFSCCADAANVALHVLYVATDATHQTHYRQLATDYPQVKFVAERDFHTDLLALIKGASELLFVVDDNLFVQPFRIADAIHALADNQDAIGFSLRLGRNTTYCYPFDKSQQIPPLSPVGKDIIKFRWSTAELDFAYPLEVSSSLYRARDLSPLLAELSFKNPNTLEQKLSEHARRFSESLPSLLCFERSVAFCNPVNKVQTICANNRAGTKNQYSAETFARCFTKGERIDVSSFFGYIPRSCHEEADFIFTPKSALVGQASSSESVASTPTRVSVVIPCYNYGRYLRDCVRSVAEQTFRDFEIIILNDGSTDNSLAVAKACAAEFSDLEIKIIDQPNSGQPAISRNNGIAQARGELIVALDADDWIAPSFLEECVRTLDSSPTLGVAFTDTVYHHENGRTEVHPAGEFTAARLRQNNQLSCCSLFRKTVWETIGGFRTNVRGYEDWDYWLAAAAAGFTGKRIAKPLFFYRAKDTGVFSETVANDKSRRARIRLNNPSCYSAEERAEAAAFLATEPAATIAPGTPVAGNSLDALRQTASAHYQAGDWTKCVDVCAQALKLAPDDCDVLLVYADALSKTGQVPAALATVERVIRLEPDVEDHKQMRAGFSAMLTTTAPTGLVSIIIPCYKQAEFLGDAVDSVLAQTYSNWEIIIVNDGSPDDTSAVAQSLILRHPERAIRLVEKANGGLSDARNAGINFARGDFILPLDADDRIHPEFLAKTVGLLEKNPDISIAYTDWLYFGAHQTLRHALDYNFERLCTKENLFTCASLYRKTAWTAAGGYNTNMTKGLEDWDFWISCGKRGFTGKRIPEALFFYRAKAGSMIHTVQPHVRTMFARIVLNHADIYNTDLVENARKTFAAANLPPPKPSSVGVEWLKPEKNFASFQQAMEHAETAVREQRLDEALAHVEKALRVAPDAESTARAQEIKNLLATVDSASSENRAEAAASTDEIFGPEEVRSIEQLIAAHAENPNGTAIRAQLEELQQGLMNFLVTAETGKLEALFKGSFGRVFRALSKSGLVAEPPTEKSKAQVAILDEAIATPSSDGPFDYRPVLARMICAPAHRGSLATALEKIPSWFLNDYLAHVLQAPAVFVYAGEAEEYHDHLLTWARTIFDLTRSDPNAPVTIEAASFFTTKANFIPLYFSNRNTREVAEKRAAIMEFFLVKNGAAIDFKTPKRPKDRKKIKVGILSAHFGQQTETHVTLPSLQLDHTKFEICLFALKSNPGPLEDRCRSFADSFTLLPSNIHDQVRIIRDAALDVVIIGTNITAVTNQISLIALHRLAPLQLVNYCSPVSTGMRHIDGYLTGTLNDHPGLQDYFSEKLQFCEGPPGCLDYAVEAKTTAEKITRAALGLREDEIVFVNAAACFKILPELQETWAKILQQVPNSRLLLLPFNPNWSSAFPVKQFERTLSEACARHGVSADRFVMAGSLPSRADVKSLLSVADVYLDTFPFSGSISVIDPLELGLPPIVWEGKTHRSRMAAALLRELDIPELIVQDEAAYIALSVKLATDRAWREQLRDRVLEAMARKPKFVNAARYAEGLGELLETLTGKKSSRTLAAAGA